jgi:hypothetical protein
MWDSPEIGGVAGLKDAAAGALLPDKHLKWANGALRPLADEGRGGDEGGGEDEKALHGATLRP